MLSSLAQYGSDSEDESFSAPTNNKNNAEKTNSAPSVVLNNNFKQAESLVTTSTKNQIQSDQDEVIIESIDDEVGVSNFNYKTISSTVINAPNNTENTNNTSRVNTSSSSSSTITAEGKRKTKQKKVSSTKKALLMKLAEHSLFNNPKDSSETTTATSKRKLFEEQERFLDDDDGDFNDEEDQMYYSTSKKQKSEAGSSSPFSDQETDNTDEMSNKLYLPKSKETMPLDDNEDEFNLGMDEEEEEEIYNNLKDVQDEQGTTNPKSIPEDILAEMKRQGIDVDQLGEVDIVDVGENGSSELVNLEVERRRALIEKHKREIYMTKDEQDALKQFNFTVEGAGNKHRVKVAKTKNQISFLAQQATGRELEMAERLEKSRQSNSSAKKKYGWR
ncbi:hypothetical protein C9374_012332 [Naegleria lovaniensis]|uniref:Uncharacterized protein n=1 Tax=Naegleria lovaniensis TaxID=51637 RepID=A0AA88GEN9_NAELO|nr:uncharacterized protein C9374_012332 [Naegleria lovaniensis]KAG2373229.1 hypothetical protein C9374_012332 [Naegleria lovaniensis]